MEVQRLLKWFDEGRLVRPRGDGGGGMAAAGDAVELMRAIATLCDADGLSLTANTLRLAKLIGPADHYVFVIIDGLGLELLRNTLDGGFLRDHLAAELQAVFPSTTAAALTAYATAAYPAEHGVPGWWSYLDEHRLTAISLPFVDRFTGEPLDRAGVRREDVFALPGVISRFGRETRAVTFHEFAGTSFSNYAAGDVPQLPYRTVAEAVDVTAARVHGAARPSYTQVYLPQLDKLCHARGVSCPQVRTLLTDLDREMARLHAALGGRARLIICADHGHISVAPSQVYMLHEDDPILDDLVCPPTGDGSVPLFHVKPGRTGSFARRFRDRYGEHFALLSLAAVEELRLLGPGPLTPLARRRFGDFMAVAPEPATLHFRPSEQHPALPGIHSGLRPGEMCIPLVLG